MKVRNSILGPMTPDLNIMRLLYERMDAMLPEDAHLHCDGRLHVSVTRFDNGKNVLLNSFNSREELLQALMCSCFIPVYCGYEPPVFHGVAYVDAALSNNSPCLNKHTVTVAPFSGNSGICPENDGVIPKSFTLSNTSIGSKPIHLGKEEECNLISQYVEALLSDDVLWHKTIRVACFLMLILLTTKNMYMLFRVLFPGSPDIQKEFCQKGYNDALRFLRDNDLIPCSECLSCKENPSHVNCKSPEYPIPSEITNEIEQAVEKFKQNLGYRLLQYRSMKVLYYMNMPSIVTAKIAYVVISAILQKVQSKAGSCVDDIWSHFLQKLKEGLYRQNNNLKLPFEIEESEKKSPSCIVENMHQNEVPSNERECAIVSSNDEAADASETSNSSKEDLTVEVQIQVPQNIQNSYPPKIYPIQSINNICQLGYPLCESKKDIQVPEMLKTYVY